MCIRDSMISLPYLLFSKIRSIHQRNEQHYISNILKFGFIYSGYKRSVYYWEFIIFFKKLLLIIIIVILCEFPQGVVSLSVLFVIAVSYKLQTSNKPYLSSDLNKLEELSLGCSAVVVFSISLYNAYKESNNPIYLEYLLVITLALTTLSFIIFTSRWAVLYIPALIQKLEEGKGIYCLPGLIYKYVRRCFASKNDVTSGEKDALLDSPPPISKLNESLNFRTEDEQSNPPSSLELSNLGMSKHNAPHIEELVSSVKRARGEL
eukprot:TRINITY_DN12562_c0_g1_i2.p1 TRINITY_DN12562_c0_g1~~TRINITY_DN12562_c0_g1_i2.p1  ORF type:complete len:282 (-),score=52.66 TRINITY_DN12562_c0_g1_i2:82-870(-)